MCWKFQICWENGLSFRKREDSLSPESFSLFEIFMKCKCDSFNIVPSSSSRNVWKGISRKNGSWVGKKQEQNKLWLVLSVWLREQEEILKKGFYSTLQFLYVNPLKVTSWNFIMENWSEIEARVRVFLLDDILFVWVYVELDYKVL